MSKKINYVFCRKCRASNSLSSFLTNEGEMFFSCDVCGSDEIIFHQDHYQNADNVNNLASTGKEVDYDHNNR